METISVTCRNCGSNYKALVDPDLYVYSTKCDKCGAVAETFKVGPEFIRPQQFSDRSIPEKAPEAEKSVPPDGTVVWCDNPNCGKDKIGIFRDGMLHVKYRERDLLADGVLYVKCRRCGKMVLIDTGAYPTSIEQVALPLSGLADNVPDEFDEEGEPKVDATDAALKEAKERGIDITKVTGTGKDGKIVQPDITRYAEEQEGKRETNYIGWKENEN